MREITRAKIVVRNAANSDIRRVLESQVAKAKEQTKDLAKKLKGDTEVQTCYNVWKFLKNRIKYKEDSIQFQDIRLPKRLIKDGIGDCKSFALLTAGVLSNCGIESFFTYTSYNHVPVPSHVYVTTKNGVIIDGVWSSFNSEKKPVYKQHKRI